jgi:hypothetical protein
MIIGATLCWSSGTFATPRVQMPSNPVRGDTYEMVTAGVVLLAAGAAVGEFGRVHRPPFRRTPGWRWRT